MLKRFWYWVQQKMNRRLRRCSYCGQLVDYLCNGVCEDCMDEYIGRF